MSLSRPRGADGAAGRAGLRRRTVLGLPVVGLPLLGLPVVGLAACGADVGPDEPVTESDGRPGGRIAYGEDPSQYGELLLPDGEPRGVVVVIHGGFWQSAYDLSLGTPLAESLAAQGWAAWNLEYRRVGNGGGTPETFDDVAAGIDKLASLGLDLTTVITLGHSAGGHLAAWAASRGRFEAWAGGVAVTAVVAQAGVLDLVTAYDEDLGGGAVESLLGHAPGPDDAPLDPQQQLPLEVPVWCIHGDDDRNVPLAQSTAYVAAATAAGARATMVEVAGDHFVLIDPSSDAWSQTLAILDGLGTT